MILYNVTLKVDWSVHEAWLAWMQQEHMPEVVSTGCFIRSYLFRLLDTDETEGPTYAAQYFAQSRTDYNRYMELHASLLRKKVLDLWGEKIVAFRSLMETVH